MVKNEFYKMGKVDGRTRGDDLKICLENFYKKKNNFFEVFLYCLKKLNENIFKMITNNCSKYTQYDSLKITPNIFKNFKIKNK